MEENTTEYTSEQVDTLHDTVYGSEEEQGLVEEQNLPPADPEFEINWKGETKKLPLSKIKDLAQQGYDYSQKMSEFNKQRLAAEQAKKDFDEKYTRYNELDAYVQKDPSWWDHVNQQYQSRGQAKDMGVAPSTAQQLTNDPEAKEIIESLKNEIHGIKSWKETKDQEEMKAQQQKDEAKYNEDLEGLQKMYPTIDFHTPNAEGASLEYNVLKYANENGIKSFKDAFLISQHETLMKLAENKAREAHAKESQQLKKLGLTVNKQTSKQNFNNKNIRSQSYDDITKDILANLDSYK